MGLIRAGIDAASGVLSDSWRDYFYCDAMSDSVLAQRGYKRGGNMDVAAVSPKRRTDVPQLRGTGGKGSDNIISSGSVVAVNEGQCALIVDNGRVAEVCAETGEFIYDSSTEPSIFYGDLGDAILNTFKSIGTRFSFGGIAPKDQRVYYINTKEIMGNRYGTVTPIPFRVVDSGIGLDVDVSLRCNGEYSYRITNPVLFYTNVCGNFTDVYAKSAIDSMLKTEILTALQPALGRISDKGVRPSALPSHTVEICDSLNEVLSKKWGELRGMQISSFNMNPPSLPKEDQEMITNLQRSAVMRDPSMAAASLVQAQGDAMKTAAANSGGAMMGFMGMNMAAQQGGFNAQQLYSMAQKQSQSTQSQPQQSAAEGVWRCACGTENNGGRFCTGCGKPKPAESDSWSCSCGAQNKGKFCTECGKPRPAGAPLFRCDKCGWQPDDPTNPPKFCPECGDPFDANDMV